MKVTDPDYLIQSSSEIWQVIREAHDYLHAYLHDPTSRIYSEGGVIHFRAGEWGTRVDGGCAVCLAGLWYLRKEDVLLEEMMHNGYELPQIADFLDDLRYLDRPSKIKAIEDWVGIDIPDDLDTELSAKAADDNYWDEDNPYHMLAFLKWLLEHKPVLGAVPNG